MKNLLLLVVAFMLASVIVACGKEEKKVLVVWTFTDELGGMIDDYYLRDFPDLAYDIEVVVTPNESYQETIDPVLATGINAPDVFTMEAAFVRKYIESDFTMNIKDLPIESTTRNTLQYTLDVATDSSGSLKALSWQATPGAFFYRRDLAESLLGITTLEEMQAAVSDWDQFLATARTVNERSNGASKLVGSPGELSNIFYANKATKWVVNNTLTIDPSMATYFELAKTLISENLTNEANQWSDEWFAGMSTDTIMGYFLPTWGLHYVLSPNSATFNDDGTVDASQPSTYGDWAVIQGPGTYFWGGTWLAARKGTEMVAEAAHLIEYLTLNEDFLTEYAKNSGDFVNNKNVIDNIKNDFSHGLLNGQNHYLSFAELAVDIDASKLSGFDLTIQDALNEQMLLFASGDKTYDQAIADFKAAVKTAFPDVTVN